MSNEAKIGTDIIRKVVEIYGKVKNYRNDFFCNKLKLLSKIYNFVTAEFLNMHESLRILIFDKYVSDNTFGLFLTFFAYKFIKGLKNFEIIDKKYFCSKIFLWCGTFQKNWICWKKIGFVGKRFCFGKRFCLERDFVWKNCSLFKEPYKNTVINIKNEKYCFFKSLNRGARGDSS
ncbi:MAG: hypothetical protein LBF22_09610 [Deltaproteobacteria bacterium]|jgi:hypothetical protein|nr:hypothetical protein [Deltaproteobacteria bacterium]